jgi:hypothetical protein
VLSRRSAPMSRLSVMNWRTNKNADLQGPRFLFTSKRSVKYDSQHSTIFTANPPRDVSLYFVFISAPVSRMVLITESSDT